MPPCKCAKKIKPIFIVFNDFTIYYYLFVYTKLFLVGFIQHRRI